MRRCLVKGHTVLNTGATNSTLPKNLHNSQGFKDIHGAIMATPLVGVRMGARHEDGRYTGMIWFRKCRGPIAAVVLLNQTKRW